MLAIFEPQMENGDFTPAFGLAISEIVDTCYNVLKKIYSFKEI